MSQYYTLNTLITTLSALRPKRTLIRMAFDFLQVDFSQDLDKPSQSESDVFGETMKLNAPWTVGKMLSKPWNNIRVHHRQMPAVSIAATLAFLRDIVKADPRRGEATITNEDDMLISSIGLNLTYKTPGQKNYDSSVTYNVCSLRWDDTHLNRLSLSALQTQLQRLLLTATNDTRFEKEALIAMRAWLAGRVDMDHIIVYYADKTVFVHPYGGLWAKDTNPLHRRWPRLDKMSVTERDQFFTTRHPVAELPLPFSFKRWRFETDLSDVLLNRTVEGTLSYLEKHAMLPPAEPEPEPAQDKDTLIKQLLANLPKADEPLSDDAKKVIEALGKV